VLLAYNIGAVQYLICQWIINLVNLQ